jgi:hypothetical protein
MGQVLYKEIYSVKEGYLSLYIGLRTVRFLARATRNRPIVSLINSSHHYY